MGNKMKTPRFFANHSKSSALVASLAIHAVLIVVAILFVAVKVTIKEDPTFEAKRVKRPKMPPKKIQVPVEVKKRKLKPRLRKRIVVNTKSFTDIEMPEITGIAGGMGSGTGDGDGGMLGFDLPELNFFGSRTSGEKVCFVVHFGPATIGDNPFSRMTGYTIRNRLEEMINEMPEYTLFNVACYWFNDTDAVFPKIMTASPENKKKVMDWMEPVNPLEGKYDHCFVWRNAAKSINKAKWNYPTRIDKKLPFYSPKWVYPYVVPPAQRKKYLPAGKDFVHWGRGVAWAILTQKPDTIFVLTTNYIDAWGSGKKGRPEKMTDAYREMCRDVYGPDKKGWPSINVVVLSNSGKDPSIARKVLKEQFDPISGRFRGKDSVIRDITDYMNDEEKELYDKYESEYGK